jgi:hypothetical protein
MLIARFLADLKNFRFKTTSFMLILGICCFILIQNIATGYTGIVPMMLVVGMVVILCLFSYRGELNKTMLVLMFSAGVAAVGYIMLTATLQIYEWGDLLTSTQRLGAGTTNYVDSKIMNVSIDPNVYGTFAIPALATAVPLVLEKEGKASTRFFLLVFSLVSLLVCIAGLSRTAFLVLVLWSVLFVVLRRSIKGAFLVAAVIGLVIIAVPDVLDAIFSRLEESDMASANGRTNLIKRFFVAWLENPITLLFGVGLYNCNVHCMPLQFLFGGGIVLFSLVAAAAISFVKKSGRRYSLDRGLPFLVTLIMFMTVPAAGLLNFMFPLVYLGLLYSAKENGE